MGRVGNRSQGLQYLFLCLRYESENSCTLIVIRPPSSLNKVECSMWGTGILEGLSYKDTIQT